MAVITSHQLMKEKLSEIQERDGPKSISKLLCVFELPFVVEEEDVKKFFGKRAGTVKKIEILRSGALVFSSAIIEFQKKAGVAKALEVLTSTATLGDFDVIVQSAEDFLAGKKPPKKAKPGEKSSAPNLLADEDTKKCIVM